MLISLISLCFSGKINRLDEPFPGKLPADGEPNRGGKVGTFFGGLETSSRVN